MTTNQSDSEGYREGYLAIFSNAIDVEVAEEAAAGNPEAFNTIRAIAESKNGQGKEAFSADWDKGLNDYLIQVRQAASEADKRGLIGGERRIFIEGIW